MAKKRNSIPEAILDRVLLDSRRRCCLCFEAGNAEVQLGAVVPIQGGLPKAETHREENLVFLCVSHQIEVEGGSISPERLRQAKSELYQALRWGRVPIGGGVPEIHYRYQRHVIAVLSDELRKWFNGQVTIHEGGDFPGPSWTFPVVPFSAEVSVGGIRLWLVAEAKYAERKIELNDLRAFAGVVGDLKANKGIFVTSTGFSDSAIQFANAEGITLAVVTLADRELKTGVIPDAVAHVQRA